MNIDDETMIRRGWAWRVPKNDPRVAVLVSPSEQASLAHALRFSIPKGDEDRVSFKERRARQRAA
jgi:hypothetical protein